MQYSTHLLRHARFVIGRNINAARLKQKMTLRYLSRKSGVPENKLDQYELGKNASALDDILKIACVLGGGSDQVAFRRLNKMPSLFFFRSSATISAMNIWFWLFLVVPPLLVFSAKPENSAWWRAGRFIFAVMAGYAILLIAVEWQWQLDHEILQKFWHQFPNCTDKVCANQPKLRSEGKALGLLSSFGWLPAIVYASLCELVWRCVYVRRFFIYTQPLAVNLALIVFMLFSVFAAYPAWLIITIAFP